MCGRLTWYTVEKDIAETQAKGTACPLCRPPHEFDVTRAPRIGVTLSGYDHTLQRDISGMSLAQYERLAVQSGFTPVGDANLREIQQELGKPEDRIMKKPILNDDQFREIWNRTSQIAEAHGGGSGEEFSDTSEG